MKGDGQMGQGVYQAKELVERLLRLRISRKDSFPFFRARRRFLTVRLDLHNKCNLRCRMCYFAFDEMRNLPLKEMSDVVIDRLERDVWPRTRELWLSCAGEPLIGRKLERVLRGAKKRGTPNVQLVTNGMALSESTARMLIDLELDHLWVSLDAADPAIFDRIRVLAKLDQILANLNRFQAMKRERGAGRPALGVLVLMMVENIGQWDRVVDLAADLGADPVIFNPQTYYAQLAPEDRLWDHREEANEALARSEAVARKRGITLFAPPPFRLTADASASSVAATGPRAHTACRNPFEHLIITPDGGVRPCAPLALDESFGSLEEGEFDEIYYGPAFRRLRESIRTGQYGATCLKCPATVQRDLNDPEAFTPRDLVFLDDLRERRSGPA